MQWSSVGAVGSFIINNLSGLDCSDPIQLSCGIAYQGDTTSSTNNITTYSCSIWNESGPEVVHTITTTNTGNLTATLSNLSADLDVFILSACDASLCLDYGNYSSTYSNAPPGTYYIVVDGYQGTAGTYTLTVNCEGGVTNTSPSVTVNSPNEGENWSGTQSILWTATDAEQTGTNALSATLYYGTSATGPWTEIVSGQTCTSAVQASYSWDTTSVSDDTYWVRIVVSDGAGGNGEDVSDASFAINNSGPCTIIVPDDYSTIQDAINDASDECEIIVKPGATGVYYENIIFNNKKVTVRADGNVTINGSQNGSVVTFEGDRGSILDGFTITNGSGTTDSSYRCGGGIYCKNSSPKITGCTITNNMTNTNAWTRGGGIYCYNSSIQLIDSIISSNMAKSSSHYYGVGGGIYCESSPSSMTITNCAIRNNVATYGGGGIVSKNANGASPIIVNSTISGNLSEDSAGGLLLVYGDPTISNCVISGNSAHDDGGGVYCSISSPHIINSTISGNKASRFGGSGIYVTSSSSPKMVNSIVWGNTDIDGRFNEIYGAIDVTYSNIQHGSGVHAGEGNINIEPNFIDARPATEAPISAGNYHLQAGSPCIDKGNPSSTPPDFPADDIDGNTRPQDGNGDGIARYDMGADEYVGPPPGNNISLTTGWNLISLPQQATNTTIGSVLSSISGKYVSVWAFANNSWEVYDPASPGFSDLAEMEAGWGYWIKMTEAASFSVSGTTPSDTIPLVSGWNLVGYNSTNSQDTADALASINGKYVSVWAFIAGSWKVYDPTAPGFSDLLIMEPNYGYWINTTQVCDWTLP